MLKTPCPKDCPKRTVKPNCHSYCEEYLEWRKQKDAIAEARYKHFESRKKIQKPYLKARQKKEW